MAKRRSGEEERVRSIAEIRGSYGLADEEFRVLAEGSRNRQVRTVLGREARKPPQKLVPTRQAVMGTAKLDAPPEVEARRAQRAAPENETARTRNDET